MSANYHLADYSRWIIALADAMGWERFVLLGHSMGAAAASIAAAGAPQRLAGLILLDGIGPLAFTPEQEVRRLRQFLGEGATQGEPRYFSKLESAVKVRQRMGRFPISTEAARLLIHRGTVEEGGHYRWSHDERLKGPNTHYYCREQAEGILRSIETPTLLISATEGALEGWEDFARRKSCVANLQHIALPGRHHLHMEQPAVVASCINDFLATLLPE
jgi:pimeloyl-ACP methyl ester carboxylesterase